MLRFRDCWLALEMHPEAGMHRFKMYYPIEYTLPIADLGFTSVAIPYLELLWSLGPVDHLK